MGITKMFKPLAAASIATLIGMEGAMASTGPALENPDLARPSVTNEISIKDANIVEARGGGQAIGRMLKAIGEQYQQDRTNCEAKYQPGTPDLQNCYNWATGWAAVKYTGVGALAVAGGAAKLFAGMDDDHHNKPQPPKFG